MYLCILVYRVGFIVLFLIAQTLFLEMSDQRVVGPEWSWALAVLLVMPLQLAVGQFRNSSTVPMGVYSRFL